VFQGCSIIDDPCLHLKSLNIAMYHSLLTIRAASALDLGFLSVPYTRHHYRQSWLHAKYALGQATHLKRRHEVISELFANRVRTYRGEWGYALGPYKIYKRTSCTSCTARVPTRTGSRAFSGRENAP
jgi:hypothetical protein